MERDRATPFSASATISKDGMDADPDHPCLIHEGADYPVGCEDAWGKCQFLRGFRTFPDQEKNL